MAGVLDHRARDPVAEFGPQIAPLVARVQGVALGDDLEDRRVASAPVALDVQPLDRFVLHRKRLRIPAGEPDRRVVSRSEERELERGEALAVREAQIARSERRRVDLRIDL